MLQPFLSLLLVIVTSVVQGGGAFSFVGYRGPYQVSTREIMTLCTHENVCDENMPLLLRRLVDAGVPVDQMTFCEDEVRESTGKEVLDSEEKKESSDADDKSVCIKTLIWEVTCDDIEKHYITTASKIDHKIKLSALRTLVEREISWWKISASFQISLAPRHMAESLSGFRSGSIPPIGHTTPMPLFIDSSILESKPKGTDGTTVSIGSGILGQSLLIPMSEFINVARKIEKGFYVGSFVQGLIAIDSTGLQQTERELSPLEIRQQRKLERVSRWPEPKDRLEEFRRFASIVDKSKLIRSTARKQGRVDEMKTLVAEAVATGVFPQLFKISVQDGIGKNALHVCAWRGDFETVKLIVETAEELYPALNLVNVISEGGGNYGKTAIFFALTQCREEVVRYLVAHGADLLIVDNKGQTPCSIAVSHLTESACQFLFDAEAQQLKAGGTFRNYRASHSDGKLYGDLDPRFPIDDVNIGTGDMAGQILAYEESVRKAPPSTIFDQVPSRFQPRSLRPTVRWWIREARSLAEANEFGYVPGAEVTFTQPRSTSPRKARIDESDVPSTRTKRDSQLTSSAIDSLPRLTIGDVLEESEGAISDQMFLVRDMESLQELENEVEQCLRFFSDPEMHVQSGMTYDDTFVDSTWAIDCEWRPSNSFGVENPVATLQLSTRRKAFLVDLQVICQEFRVYPQKATDLESQLDRILSKIFTSSQLPLLGYGVLQDVSKLAASFPHLTCFANYVCVIDLQTVASVIYAKALRQDLSSLQKIGAFFLGKRLDKREQCSDWAQRPLSQSQLDYALLDAAILPRLLKIMVKESAMAEGYNGQFFKIQSHLQSNIRFRQVDPAPGNQTYDVPMGTIKSILGRQFARQCWPSTRLSPPGPRLVPKDILEGTRAMKKEKEVFFEVGGKRSKAVQLKTLGGNLGKLPVPGITLGFTKDSCVTRVIGHKLLNTFPDGTRIGFNRKAGVAETSNAWILFCNFGTKAESGKTYSRFFEDGRLLSFRLRPNSQSGKSSESGLYRYLMSSRGNGESDKSILLFVREGTRSRYVYCGFCKCRETNEMEDGATNVLFELLDYDELVGASRIASDFVDLVTTLQDRYHDHYASSDVPVARFSSEARMAWLAPNDRKKW
jgi:prolyl-tRNA editing enzyme YbaK/EbsC (Cys-tRNA(Pro) deacylase)